MFLTNIHRMLGSGMSARTVWLGAIASNMANAGSPAANAESVYKARSPVFAAVYERTKMLDRNRRGGPLVKVVDVIETGGWVQRYEPKSSLANAEGYVFYPDINIVEQMGDMTLATRGFETLTAVSESVKSMQKSLLRLGEP